MYKNNSTREPIKMLKPVFELLIGSSTKRYEGKYFTLTGGTTENENNMRMHWNT